MSAKGFCRAAVCLLALVFGGLTTADSAYAGSIVWLTRPSDLRQLSFTRAGLVKELLVEEGDNVKAGQLLMRLDDSAEQQEFKKLDFAAKDEVRIRYAEVALEQSRVDCEKYEKAFGSGSVTTTELQHARLEVKGKEASLGIAKLEHLQAVADRDQMKARLDQMRIISPIDGHIERIAAREGVAAQALDMVVAVVCTDPLWSDVPVSFELARKLKIGGTAKVVFLNAADTTSFVSGDSDDAVAPADAIDAKIIFKATMADLAGKITVRIEFANPEGVPAAGHVKIWFNTGEGSGEENKAD